jgi:hypothetical protein
MGFGKCFAPDFCRQFIYRETRRRQMEQKT